MEAEYGVGIKNRFAFLDDDDNDGDYAMTAVKTSPLKSKNEKKPADPKIFGGGKPESKVVTATSAAPKRNAQKERGGGKVEFQDDRKTQSFHEDRRNARENGGMTGMSSENGSRNQGLRGRGDGRGFRRDGPPNRRNFRGRQGENKEGQQQRNDRDPESENTSETTGQDVPASTTETKEGDVEQVEATEGEDGESAPAQEKTLTLAEWKALQVPREKPVFNIRKPGEGEVASKLEKLVLKKREDDLGDQDEEYETDEVYYPQRAGKQKLISDVGFTTGYQKQRRGGGKFGSSARVGGGDSSNAVSEPREGRDTTVDKPRGRPRYGPRGGHNHHQSQAPRIDDAADFPTLG